MTAASQALPPPLGLGLLPVLALPPLALPPQASAKKQGQGQGQELELELELELESPSWRLALVSREPLSRPLLAQGRKRQKRPLTPPSSSYQPR